MKPTLPNSTAHAPLYKPGPASPGDGAAELSAAPSTPQLLACLRSLRFSFPPRKAIHFFSAAQCSLFPWLRELRGARCQAETPPYSGSSWWHQVPQMPPPHHFAAANSKSGRAKGQNHLDPAPEIFFPSSTPGKKSSWGGSSAQLRVFFQPPLVVGTQIGIFPAGIKLASHLASNLLGCGLDPHGFTISCSVKGYFAIEFSKVGFPAAPRCYLSAK